MSGSRILWRTNRKLSGLVIDAPIALKARSPVRILSVRHLR